ncbi:MAG: Unknown protein [uncultured Sulfurovum sp.]|uniref:Outer membrane protein beta-barrel domain-containing protein n=1 Tax=uncultured Sulfurovum sp. TaxID=269237 RepID=A0A6S6TX61_9BACT|nr:MAG: Unknown protein [uncultured Sulfurovum sp.]
MKKSFILSTIAVTAISTIAFAGGDIEIPEYIPVEPIVEQQATTPVYVGVGLTRGRYYDSCGNCEYEDVTYGMMLRAGYDFNEFIGIEARAIATFWKDDELSGQKLQHFGLYAKPQVQIDESFNAYALLGYGWTQTSTNSGSKMSEVDESGFAAGLGLEYALEGPDQGLGLFVDYQRLLIDSDQPDMDVVSAGVTYDF